VYKGAILSYTGIMTLPVPYSPGNTPNIVAELWDDSDPRAVVNLLPPVVREHFKTAYRKSPELFHMDESTLKKRFKDHAYIPTPTDNRLRLRFWEEYDWACAQGSKMVVDNIIGGICGRTLFYQTFLMSTTKIAWLLCPPANYLTYAQEALHYGLDQLREVLEIPHMDSKGRPNTKLLELKAKITFMLDQRVHGAVVQRIEQKSMNLNIGMSDYSAGKAVTQMTQEQLEVRMKELERRERQAMNLPGVKVEVEVDDEAP
jgi:hypothetical protein